LGFTFGLLSIVMAFIIFIVKILFWNSLPLGYAPLGISMLLIFGVLLFFIGMLGEYVGVIHTYTQRRPIVVERERINF
jgi:dolichol-phosphate mannosyltransferase